MHQLSSTPSSRRFSSRLILLGAALALLAVAVWLIPGDANAVIIPAPGVCAYYSDATFTQVVGARGTGCCGQVINWGITTAFKRCERLYCTDQICPN